MSACLGVLQGAPIGIPFCVSQAACLGCWIANSHADLRYRCVLFVSSYWWFGFMFQSVDQMYPWILCATGVLVICCIVNSIVVRACYRESGLKKTYSLSELFYIISSICAWIIVWGPELKRSVADTFQEHYFPVLLWGLLLLAICTTALYCVATDWSLRSRESKRVMLFVMVMIVFYTCGLYLSTDMRKTVVVYVAVCAICVIEVSTLLLGMYCIRHFQRVGFLPVSDTGESHGQLKSDGIQGVGLGGQNSVKHGGQSSNGGK